MGRTRTKAPSERAECDTEIDLGSGYTTVIRQGDIIPVAYRDMPSKRASMPKGMATQPDEPDRPRGDLASDRMTDGAVAG